MHNKYTLVVLAAGIGSRYGGTKQLDEVSTSGASIMEFSIFDAIKAGFNKVVFILRKDILEEVKADFDAKIAGRVTVVYVCQETTNIPEEFRKNDRTKPWGTGHALLVAKSQIQEEFCVINADDFYGFDAFKSMLEFLKSSQDQQQYAMVGYPIENTLSANGTVSRGQCYLNTSRQLIKIIERTSIAKKHGLIYFKTGSGKEEVLPKSTLVSMNFWGFHPAFFKALEDEFHQFLRVFHTSLTAEFFLPSVVDALLHRQLVHVEVLETSADWMGVTYKEDKASVVQKIERLIAEGVYPVELWK